MSGEQQLRAFIERILRLKEEQDTIAADIREVYAEAKGSGFDKTAMGQLVAHLRKVEKVGVAAVEEGQTVFDTYLDAYRRATGTGVATHTHEASQSYAEVKGGTELERTVDALREVSHSHGVNFDGYDPATRTFAGEITEQEQPETASQSVQPQEATVVSEYAGTSSDENQAPHSNPQPISSPEADQPEAVVPPPTTVSGEPFEPPAFLKKDKSGCLKLNNGHCKIGFATDALCSACNQARMARAGA